MERDSQLIVHCLIALPVALWALSTNHKDTMESLSRSSITFPLQQAVLPKPNSLLSTCTVPSATVMRCNKRRQWTQSLFHTNSSLCLFPIVATFPLWNLKVASSKGNKDEDVKSYRFVVFTEQAFRTQDTHVHSHLPLKVDPDATSPTQLEYLKRAKRPRTHGCTQFSWFSEVGTATLSETVHSTHGLH